MRLALSGYYGAGNLGDEALLAGLLDGVTPTHDVVVLSTDPAATRALHGVRAVQRLAGLLPAVAGSDALVSGGGGLLQDVTSARSLQYYLGVITLARRLRRRVAVFGQSLGPLSARGARAVARALAGVPMGLRDTPSLRVAHDLGLVATRVGDTALLLEVPPAAPRDAVVLVPRAGYAAATQVLVDVGRAALARGLAVEAAAFHPAADRTELAALAQALPNLCILPLVAPREAVRALAGAHLVVSARLHGLVLAAAAGTPHAGIAYDPKVSGFAAETGAPCWPVPDDAARARTTTGLVRLLEAPPLDRDLVAAARQRAASGVAWLLSTLADEAPTPRRLRS